MEINQILDQLDLTPTEIEIYLEFFKSGENNAPDIGRKLNIDKATTYRSVKDLVQKGLLTKHPQARADTYTAASPEILNELMKNKKYELETQSKILEDYVSKIIKNSKNETKDSPFITVEKGPEAHMKMMKRQLECKDKVVRQKLNTNAPIYDYSKYPEHGDYIKYMNKFIDNRKKKNIFMKQLVHADIQKKLMDVHITSKKLNKEVRILPAEIMKDISFKVFDDYFIITIYTENVEDLTLITIKDEYTSTLIKSLYDFIYERSVIYYGKSSLPQIQFQNGTKVAKLGIGSSGIGGYWYGDNPYKDDQNDISQIQHALSKGANYLDCCLMYGEGHTIELIHKATQNYPREDLFFTCKLTKVNMTPVKDIKEIEQQCDEYLKKLDIDYIDLFEIHGRSSLEIPKPEAANEIEKLIDKGKVRMWAVSNYNVENLKEVMPANKHPLAANEIPYSLAHRNFEQDGTMKFCKENNILNICYFITGKGLLNHLLDDPNENLIKKLMEKYNKTLYQIAINWVLHKDNVMGIIKSTNGTHVNENYAALDWEMEAEDYQKLDELEIVNPWMDEYVKGS